MHLQEENPDRIDECIRLYTEDAVWEAPARLVSYQGRETIKKMYLKVFNGVEDFVFTPVERWATPNRVFDNSYATFRIVLGGTSHAEHGKLGLCPEMPRCFDFDSAPLWCGS